MQIAFAVPLLVGASVLIRSAIAVGRVNLGFVAQRVSTVAFEVSRTKHASDDDVSEYYARLVESVRAVPGVATAAIVNRIPLVGAQTNPVTFENVNGAAREISDIDSRTITPEYFATLGIPLIAGRTFTDHDNATSPAVGIIDERLARTLWPGEVAIGKRFRGPDDRFGHDHRRRWPHSHRGRRGRSTTAVLLELATVGSESCCAGGPQRSRAKRAVSIGDPGDTLRRHRAVGVRSAEHAGDR